LLIVTVIAAESAFISVLVVESAFIISLWSEWMSTVMRKRREEWGAARLTTRANAAC
jgi:hypothetical protein